MTLTHPDWASIADLPSAALRNELFSLLQRVSIEHQLGDSDNPDVLTVVPRVADLLANRPDLSDFKILLTTLARSVGLWNYIDKSIADSRDQMTAEAATIQGLGSITLHREQVAALNSLLSGNNLVLSAPTSFGKSVLIDAAIATNKFARVAIVLPTIALLDEFRRRLVKRFSDQYDIIMHHSEKSDGKRVIFLGTQERLINRDDLGALDLVVVDEFYKLDPARKDERSIVLNAAVYKLLRISRQFFFLGPNVESVQIAGDTRFQFTFLRTRFSTVAVDTYDLSLESDKPARLREEILKKDNWPALIFVSSPDRANSLAATMIEAGHKLGQGDELADWVSEQYSSSWSLIAALRAGFGLHHGRIPRALASRTVKMFNDGKLPVLLCTSTLIEGVNTAAQTVLIYDKKIDRSNYDFFTFSNIRGRAGRLGQYHIGRVYLFHSPPAAEDIDLTPPLFGDLDEAPDELLVHIGDEDTTPAISDRIEQLAASLDVEPAILRRFTTIGIDTLSSIKELTLKSIGEREPLAWSGYPNFDQVEAVCRVLCEVKSSYSFGAGSPRQLAYFLLDLRRCATMRIFFQRFTESTVDHPERFENVFKFLRACEYSIPVYFSAVELFVKNAGKSADYAYYIAEMARWFRSEALKNLEEEGIPIQISERFLASGDTARTLGRRLKGLAQQQDKRLSKFEIAWVIDALPD